MDTKLIKERDSLVSVLDTFKDLNRISLSDKLRDNSDLFNEFRRAVNYHWQHLDTFQKFQNKLEVLEEEKDAMVRIKSDLNYLRMYLNELELDFDVDTMQDSLRVEEV